MDVRAAIAVEAGKPLIVDTVKLEGPRDGEVLVESHAMLDYLDSLAPAGQALFPTREPERHRALKVAALATGAAEKAVSPHVPQR